MLQDILSLEQDKVELLLDNVKKQISMDPLKFNTFVNVLRKAKDRQRTTKFLCDKLRSTCGECDNVCLSTSTDLWCSGVCIDKMKFDTAISSGKNTYRH